MQEFSEKLQKYDRKDEELEALIDEDSCLMQVEPAASLKVDG